MNLKIKNTTGIVLNGNTLSGNTYPIKDYIKSYLGGKWDKENGCWIIDVEKLNNIMARGGYIHIDTSADAAPTTGIRSNWYHMTSTGPELNEDF
jgi:primase-polymerase (primpol)-like protein